MKKILLLLSLVPLWAGCCHSDDREPAVRNVIYMIGDGMGLAQVSLLQIENGYAPTAFDRAQNVGLVVTRSANNRVTDSAAAGTALATGHKTNNGMLGMIPDGGTPASMMALAREAGKATGIVVTCHLQHATPGAFFAHTADRGRSADITRDMLAADYDLLMGGGARWLSESCDEQGDYFAAFARKGYALASTIEQIEAAERTPLLAVVAEESMDHAPERGDYLPRAVRKSLGLLDAAGKEGFLLMVEGSLIDYAGHANDAGWLLAEMRDFDRAVAEAMDFADRTPGTLVVVVADHETGGLTIPSVKADFREKESGLNYRFSTGSHSGTMLPVYLYGAGAERINGVMDNTELSRSIMALMGLTPDEGLAAAAADRVE